MSTIEKTKQTTLPANVSDELAAFATAAAENLQADIGTLLTYRKRRYVYGKEKTELPLGTELVAIMNEVRHGFVKWMGGKIVKHAIGRVIDGFKPDREVLGDDDESNWPLDYNNKRADPWQKTVYVPLVSRDGTTLFTFSTHSFFGRDAAYKLLQQYAAQARQHPGCYPIVELNTTTNPTKKYGDIDSPSLSIVDWQDRPQLALPSIAVDKPDDDRSCRAREMDDVIPF